MKVIKKVKEEISKSFKLSWPLSKLQRGCCQKEREGGTENLEEILFQEIFKTFNKAIWDISQMQKEKKSQDT